MKLRIATCMTLPEVDVDEAPLAAALAAAGVDAALVAWDDPRVDWDAPTPTILRSTWNYSLDVSAFLGWIDRVARVAPLWNPPDIVRGNVHKRYLLDLAARGVPVVPTMVIERGDAPAHEPGVSRVSHELGDSLRASASGKIVVKPEVGAGSRDTRVFSVDDDSGDYDAHLAAIRQHGAALVQPYLTSVETYGERSLVCIYGALSHAIRKAPRFSGDNESVTGPFPIADEERAVAEKALAPIADRILYGRVDLARDEKGQPVIMELELVEPSLFFVRGPGSVERFVHGLLRRLR